MMTGKAILFGVVLAAGMMFAPLAQAAEKITNDIHYDLKDWSPELLRRVEAGPDILPRDMVINLKPYPANTSQETADELAVLKKFAADERTPEQLEKIQHEHTLMPLYRTFSEAGYYDFNTHPVLNNLLAVVEHDVSFFILREKKTIQRARPTQLASDLTTVILVPAHSAYPSGHAGQAYGAALVMSEVDPAHAEKYKQIAIDIAHRREIAGVHYPSDSVAGREVATQVVAALMKTDEIKKRVAQAKTEFSSSSQ